MWDKKGEITKLQLERSKRFGLDLSDIHFLFLFSVE
jgi:hypothetical protein